MRTQIFFCVSLSCVTVTATVASVVYNGPNTVVCDKVSNSQTQYFVVFGLLGTFMGRSKRDVYLGCTVDAMLRKLVRY